MSVEPVSGTVRPKLALAMSWESRKNCTASHGFAIQEPYQPALDTAHCIPVSKTLLQSNPYFFLEPGDETFHCETGFRHTFLVSEEKLSKMVRNLPKVTDLSPFFDNCDLL